MKWITEKWRYRLLLVLPIVNGNRIARINCLGQSSLGVSAASLLLTLSVVTGWEPVPRLLSSLSPFQPSLSLLLFLGHPGACPRVINTVTWPWGMSLGLCSCCWLCPDSFPPTLPAWIPIPRKPYRSPPLALTETSFPSFPSRVHNSRSSDSSTSFTRLGWVVSFLDCDVNVSKTQDLV